MKRVVFRCSPTGEIAQFDVLRAEGNNVLINLDDFLTMAEIGVDVYTTEKEALVAEIIRADAAQHAQALIFNEHKKQVAALKLVQKTLFGGE